MYTLGKGETVWTLTQLSLLFGGALLFEYEIAAQESQILTTTVFEGQRFKEKTTGLLMPLPKDWRETTIAGRELYKTDKLKSASEFAKALVSVNLLLISREPTEEDLRFTELGIVSIDMRGTKDEISIDNVQRTHIERQKRSIPMYRVIKEPAPLDIGGHKFSVYEASYPERNKTDVYMMWHCGIYEDEILVNIHVRGYDRKEMQKAIDCVKKMTPAED